MTTDKAIQLNAMTPQEFSKHMAYNTKMEHKMESVHRMMSAYHQHQLTAIRAEVDALVADSMKKLQKAKKDSIESTVFATRAVALGDVQNILDKHIKPPSNSGSK